jgi:hypothetical protein
VIKSGMRTAVITALLIVAAMLAAFGLDDWRNGGPAGPLPMRTTAAPHQDQSAAGNQSRNALPSASTVAAAGASVSNPTRAIPIRDSDSVVTTNPAANIASDVGNAVNNPAYVVPVSRSGEVTDTNPLPASLPDATQVAFSAAGNGIPAGFPIDTSGGVQTILVNVASVGLDNTTLFQTSADNTTYYAAQCMRDDGILTSSFAGANRYSCLTDRYFRINVTRYSSGTVAGTTTLKAAGQRVSYSESVVPLATASVTNGIIPGASSASEGSRVIDVGQHSLYSLYVTTGAVPGYLMTFNARSIPADGSVAPVECLPVAANSRAGIDYGFGPPDSYLDGIVVVFSTTGCFTKTENSTAFFKWRVK